MAAPASFPLARLRSLGCRVGTTVSHNGHDWTPARERRGVKHYWEYVVTLPEDASWNLRRLVRKPVGKATIRGAVTPGVLVVYSYDRDAVAEALSHLADLIVGDGCEEHPGFEGV
jgi:hypothetical protein